jgi:hypothetical protein
MRPITANKGVVLIAVIVPFLATLLAIYLLWERAVHWSDLLLLTARETLTVLSKASSTRIWAGL